MRQEQHYQEQAVKAGLLAKRQASARARRYYNEYELQLKAKLQKRRIREEQVVFPPLSSPSFLPPPFLFSSPSPFLFLLPLVQLFTQATSLKIPSLASTDSPFLRIKLSSSFFFFVCLSSRYFVEHLKMVLTSSEREPESCSATQRNSNKAWPNITRSNWSRWKTSILRNTVMVHTQSVCPDSPHSHTYGPGMRLAWVYSRSLVLVLIMRCSTV